MLTILIRAYRLATRLAPSSCQVAKETKLANNNLVLSNMQPLTQFINYSRIICGDR